MPRVRPSGAASHLDLLLASDFEVIDARVVFRIIRERTTLWIVARQLSGLRVGVVPMQKRPAGFSLRISYRVRGGPLFVDASSSWPEGAGRPGGARRFGPSRCHGTPDASSACEGPLPPSCCRGPEDGGRGLNRTSRSHLLDSTRYPGRANTEEGTRRRTAPRCNTEEER